MHFGMYILDCHDFLAKFSNDFVLKIAASSAAMTGEIWVAMSRRLRVLVELEK
jgi:hypothetical protein